MIFAIRLSCVLAVLLCLASCERVRNEDRDRQRLQQLQNLSRHANNSNNQMRVTYEVLKIYKRYRGRNAARAKMEQSLNNKVREFESKIVLVDGVPRQGGAFWESIKNAAGGEIPDKVWKTAENLFNTTSKTLVETIVNYLMNLIVQSMSVGK